MHFNVHAHTCIIVFLKCKSLKQNIVILNWKRASIIYVFTCIHSMRVKRIRKIAKSDYQDTASATWKQYLTDLKPLILLPSKARPIVHILNQYRARSIRIKVNSAATWPKTAGPRLDVERTVSFILVKGQETVSNVNSQTNSICLTQ